MLGDRTLVQNIARKIRLPKKSGVIKAVAVTGGIASAVWVALKLKPQLYGPGGTKLSRYDPDIDKPRLRKRSNASDD